MDLTGNEDHSISLEDAATLTAAYRSTISTGDTIGEYFGGTAIQTILSQDGCVGIRIYYGIDSTGVKTLVICGVTSTGDDLYSGSLAEHGLKCPPDCSSKNALNS